MRRGTRGVIVTTLLSPLACHLRYYRSEGNGFDLTGRNLIVIELGSIKAHCLEGGQHIHPSMGRLIHVWQVVAKALRVQPFPL